MFIIIAGGGKVGYYLLRSQLKKLNEVIIIEKERERCQCILQEFGSLVVQGDACDPLILERAGISRADMILAVTDKDQDNLIICQLARKKYRVPSTIAVVNNPPSAEVFRRLGVDVAVSAIDTILERIEKRIDLQGSLSVVYRKGSVEVLEVRLTIDSPASGKTVGQLALPDMVSIGGLIRQGELLPVTDDTSLKIDDLLIIITSDQHYSTIKTILTGENISVHAP